MRKKRLYWTLQILGWSIYLALNQILVFIDPQNLAENDAVALENYTSNLVDSLVLFLMSHFFLRKIIIKKEYLKINIGRVIPRLLLTILLTSLLSFLLTTAIFYSDFDYSSTKVFLSNAILPFITYLVLYIIWTSIYFLYHYLESNNRSLKYEAAMNEMHLNQLKTQLNPHFIFNALNSMRALVDEEPKKAKIAITQLSNILRNSLITDKKRVVNFKDELNTVKDYLALEMIRFEERLKVEFDIAQGSDHFEVPPMMLQTLTENAIKHGVSNLMEGGTIEISTNIESSILKVKIRNSGQLRMGVNRPKSETGVGLINTKERLKLIYGESATFRMYNENDRFVVAEVKIPQRI
jgi:sensor histidine kinase YesM